MDIDDLGRELAFEIFLQHTLGEGEVDVQEKTIDDFLQENISKVLAFCITNKRIAHLNHFLRRCNWTSISKSSWITAISNFDVYECLFEHYKSHNDFLQQSVVDALFLKKDRVLRFLIHHRVSLHDGVYRVLDRGNRTTNAQYFFYDVMKLLSSINYTFDKRNQNSSLLVRTLLMKSYAAGYKDASLFDAFVKHLPWFCYKCGIEVEDNVIFSLYKEELKQKIFTLCLGTKSENSPLFIFNDQDALSLIARFL